MVLNYPGSISGAIAVSMRFGRNICFGARRLEDVLRTIDIDDCRLGPLCSYNGFRMLYINMNCPPQFFEVFSSLSRISRNVSTCHMPSPSDQRRVTVPGTSYPVLVCGALTSSVCTSFVRDVLAWSRLAGIAPQ